MESSLLDDGARRCINEQPRWFTPTRLLMLFCLIDMLNYTWIKEGDFKLSYFQDGVLSSAFMVGLVVASPIFANLSKT
ncbi:unnamed protein product [Sphagnum troendelagicum]|uniref:Uncharacterized protein n=1 Tax=Sphagnum troendelagicum TaxID=128251 RepID=A0ABP0TIG3_9BRYO